MSLFNQSYVILEKSLFNSKVFLEVQQLSLWGSPLAAAMLELYYITLN